MMLKSVNSRPVIKAAFMFLVLTAILGMLCFSKSVSAQVNFMNSLTPLLIVSGAAFLYTAYTAGDLLLTFSLTSLNAVGVAFQCMLPSDFATIKQDMVSYPLLFSAFSILLIFCYDISQGGERIQYIFGKLCSPLGLTIIAGTIVLSTVILLVFSRGEDNKSWLRIPGVFQIQLTEVFKVLLVVFFALLSKANLDALPLKLLRSRFVWAEGVLILTIGCLGILGEYGSIILITALAVGMTYLTFEKKRYALYMLASIIALIGVGWLLLNMFGNAYANAVANGQETGSLLKRIASANSRLNERFALWTKGIDDPALEEVSGQLKDARRAAIKGGLTGNVHPVYVLYEESDYAFIGLLARCGILVGAAVMMLFSIVLRQGLVIASEQTDKAASAIAAGMAMSISFGFIINASSASGLIPLAGLAAPFISRGGSNMLITYIASSILIYLSGNRNSLLRSVVDAFKQPQEAPQPKAESINRITR
ncbi:MAG: hypothetical protein E7559_00160 [Ruminococcaceae bacterium]|nr:hypothetical protein [Oscillospiraceae bacterium]